MSVLTITEADQLVRDKIDEAGDCIVLGFLPLSNDQEKAVLAAVRSELAKPLVSIEGLIRFSPAACLYSLVTAPARSLVDGGRFWPALKEELGLDINANHRAAFTTQCRAAWRSLGILDKTIPDTAWVHAAPFIFQAGILHFWKDALARGLTTTLKVCPPPDIEDSASIKTFTEELGRHTHNQPLLKKLLKTEVGPLLVRRLVNASVNSNWSVLPPYLQIPIKSAFSEIGHNHSLRAPFLAYDQAYQELQLILPAVSNRIATHASFWQVANRRLPALQRNAIPLSELDTSLVKADLKELTGCYNQQSFTVQTELSENIPFRIFRTETGKEKRVELGPQISLSPGTYTFIMSPPVEAGDHDEFIDDHEAFRELEIELRPGGDLLHLRATDREWSIQAALARGIYVDGDRAQRCTLANSDEHLHYGGDLGLVAYFPTDGPTEALKVEITCKQLNISESQNIPPKKTTDGSHTFHEDLKTPASKVIGLLPPGIHSLHLHLAQGNRTIEYSLWYWKGLEQVSPYLGFRCSEFPENLELASCRGLDKQNENSLSFPENYSGPTVTIALNSPELQLTLSKPGIRATIMPTDGTEAHELPNFESIVVAPGDRRSLKIESGGFLNWDITCNDRLICKLNRNRTSYVASLNGLGSELDGLVKIKAAISGSDGRTVPLLNLIKPLTASQPKHHLNNSEGCEVWKFKLALRSGSHIGVRITDLSITPEPPPGEIEPMTTWKEDSLKLDEIRFGVATIIVSGSILEKNPELEERTSIENVQIKISNSIDELSNGLWAIDFYYRENEDSDWLPLDCVENYGSSTMRFYAWGTDLPSEDAGWWERLRRSTRMIPGAQHDPKLIGALQDMTTEEFQTSLDSCLRLGNWKYPSAVWKENAHRIQEFPVYLGTYRFSLSDASATIWWQTGIRELADHARARSAPVVRQFLLASQPDCLGIQRSNLAHSLSDISHDELLLRSLDLPAQIHSAGSLKNWILGPIGRDHLDQNIIPSFSNLGQVQSGRAEDFAGFSLINFLHGAPGLKGLATRAEESHARNFRFKTTTLLSPEHLIQCVRAMQRRCDGISGSTTRDDQQALTALARSIEEMAQRIEIVAPTICEALGYTPPGGPAWWTPPLFVLENTKKTLLENVARLIWITVAISKLASHDRLPSGNLMSQLRGLLCPHVNTERTLQKRLCMLLSLAPELFGFYFALFEFCFPQNDQ